MDSLDSMDYTGLNSCHGFLENVSSSGPLNYMMIRSVLNLANAEYISLYIYIDIFYIFQMHSMDSNGLHGF